MGAVPSEKPDEKQKEVRWTHPQHRFLRSLNFGTAAVDCFLFFVPFSKILS